MVFPEKKIEEKVWEEFEEKQRIEERKFNIMCFGLEESSTLNVASWKHLRAKYTPDLHLT